MSRIVVLISAGLAVLGLSIGEPIQPASAAPTPVRLSVLGDSVMIDAYPGVAAALRATGRITSFNNAFPGFGLSSAPWRSGYPTILKQQRPDVVVELLGGWDLDALSADAKQYARTVGAAMRLLSADGRILVWVGMLPSDAAFVDDARRRAINTIFAAEALRLPGRVIYVDPDPIFAGSDGVYDAFLPGPEGAPVRIRKVDGAHLCPDGAALLGLTIIDALRGPLDLPEHRPRPGGTWVRGNWRKNDVYTDSTSFDATTRELTSDVCPPLSSESTAGSGASP